MTRERYEAMFDLLRDDIVVTSELAREQCQAALDGRDRWTTKAVMRGLMTSPCEPDHLDWRFQGAPRGLLTARAVERVGDHAVTIPTRTLYVTGSDDTHRY